MHLVCIIKKLEKNEIKDGEIVEENKIRVNNSCSGEIPSK